MAHPIARPSARTWLLGARLPTLPAAVVPVVVGTSVVAALDEAIVWWRVAAATIVALSLQIATNYANDYSDGIKGTDDTTRVGPPRLVGGGLASAPAVRRAAALGFGVAASCGALLALAAGPELFVVGAACIAAGWYYTGGSRPYGYAGAGEFFVFIFFGIVATVGSAYVHTGSVSALAFAAAVPVGAVVTALLVVNNLRDIEGDRAVGKRTLAVRLGRSRTRILYVGLVGSAFLAVAAIAVVRPPAALGLPTVILAIAPIRTVLDSDEPRALIGALVGTGRLHLALGSLLAIGLWLS